MLTIDEFIKKNGMVKTRADVYSLIRLGALKTVKKGKRRYIVDDNNSEVAENREKRNKSFSLYVPEILYQKLALIEYRKKSNIIDVALKVLSSIVEENCNFTNKAVPLRFGKEQLTKAIELEKKIEEMKKTLKLKYLEIDGRYAKRKFFYILFFLMCFVYVLEYEKPFYEKEKKEV